jgi:PAS domain S-box-containing protein
MIMVDALGHIILVNAQVEKLFGYPREQLVGKSIELLVPVRYRQGHSGHRGAFLAVPEARPMGAGRELFGLRKDGSEVPIEIGLNPLRSAEGEFVLASIVDITERKRSMEQFRLALEAAPTGMIMIDENGKLVLVNAHIEKLFGFERQELIGQPIEMLVPERFRARHPGFRGAFFADPTARPMGGGRDLFGLRKDGSEIPIEIGLNPLQTADGAFVLGSVADITGRKHAEREKELLLDELRASNAQLTTSLKEREVLLQEVHHRVKNNLQVISSLINMQLRRVKGGSSREALEECQTRVQAIALIHAQLYQSDDKARVPLTAFVRSLAANVFEATSVSRSTVSLVLDIDDVVLAVDRAIPCGLILNELITNALKHAFPGGRLGTVRIDIKRIGDGKMRLRVADDGIGIAPETEIGKTDSLGLHLVTTLAEQLNAELDVDGRDGTSYQLTFAAED